MEKQQQQKPLRQLGQLKAPDLQGLVRHASARRTRGNDLYTSCDIYLILYIYTYLLIRLCGKHALRKYAERVEHIKDACPFARNDSAPCTSPAQSIKAEDSGARPTRSPTVRVRVRVPPPSSRHGALIFL